MIHNHSQASNVVNACESAHSQDLFTYAEYVNRQVQNDHSQAIHSHSHDFHGPHGPRVLSLSPKGRDNRAYGPAQGMTRSEKITAEFERLFLSKVPVGEKLPLWWQWAAFDRDFLTGGKLLAEATQNVDSDPLPAEESGWWTER